MGSSESLALKESNEKEFIEKINRGDFKLKKEERNYLRKLLLKNIKKLTLIKKFVERNIEETELKMSKTVKISEINVPIFDGKNYNNWKFRILNILEYNECQAPAIREKDKENQEDWNKLNLKAKTILIGCIADSQLEFIKECNSALKIIQTFDELYSTKSTPMQIICREKLSEIQMKNYESVEEFFQDFEKLCNKYITAGGTLNTEEKIRYLIKSLTASYSQIGDFIDIVPREQQTVEYVKSKIKEKSLSKIDNDKRTNVSTYSIKTKGLCYICDKPGHKQQDCWFSEKNQQNKKDFSNSHNPGRVGYQYQRGRGSFRGRSRGGRGRGQFRQQQQYTNGQQQQQQNQDISSWIVQVNHQQAKIRC